ncbi:MAG: hypothetical protein ACQEQU_02905 [Spirochaetota bacterium]
MKHYTFPEEERIVTAYVDDVQLEGYLEVVSESDYVVSIRKPFKGLQTGLHIPYFAMQTERRYVREGQIAKKCYESARNSLKELYSIGNTVLEHIDAMLRLLPEYEAEEHRIHERIDQTLRRMPRSHTYTSRVLKEKMELEHSLRDTFDQLYGNYFDTIPGDMDKQIISFLRNQVQEG